MLYGGIKQKEKNSQRQYSIVLANADLKGMLDLTDYEIYTKMSQIWEKLCTRSSKNSNVPLGKKLNLLFETQNFSLLYSLVKVYGKYNRTPSDGIFKFDYKSMSPEPTIGVKCIYCIKNAECIIEKEYLEKEE